MTLTGKGYYIWQLKYCENGDPDRITALAKEANLTHVLIKIADGAFPYNIDLNNGFDYALPAIQKLQRQNIAVWGWQYVYGDYPDQEAEIAVSRALDLGVNGFVINAEKEYSSRNKAPAASRYMNILRNNLGSMPLALSSYRYPTYHQNLPWLNFLERCDYNMPQIYWILSHGNAAEQLQRSVNEFKNIHPFRPIIPTGPTFKQDGWIPQKEDMIKFMEAAKKLNLPAVNFWYWEGCRRYMPDYWNLVRDYHYEEPPQKASFPEIYLSALNSQDPDEVTNLYSDNAVHIRPESAVKGKEAIREWVVALFKDSPQSKFTLVSQSRVSKVHSFQWERIKNNGNLQRGQDTIGVIDQKIRYHYSFINQNN